MASEKVETVIAGNYVEMEREGNAKDGKNKLSRFFWHGGSVYDAWFSCASNQVLQDINIISSLVTHCQTCNGQGLICWLKPIIFNVNFKNVLKTKEKESHFFGVCSMVLEFGQKS